MTLECRVKHIKRVYSDGELNRESTIKKYLIVQNEGGIAKSRNVDHYNLQAIIAVGFKINNSRTVQFRKWAGQVVKDYTIQGWVMDKERLIKGHMFTDTGLFRIDCLKVILTDFFWKREHINEKYFVAFWLFTM